MNESDRVWAGSRPKCQLVPLGLVTFPDPWTGAYLLWQGQRSARPGDWAGGTAAPGVPRRGQRKGPRLGRGWGPHAPPLTPASLHRSPPRPVPTTEGKSAAAPPVLPTPGLSANRGLRPLGVINCVLFFF